MNEPLAFRVRPQTLSDVIGHQNLVGEQGILRRSVERKMPFSMILFGPPGTGKTTIARAYCKDLGIHFAMLNAVTTDKKEMEKTIGDCRLYQNAVIVMDEVHRLDKAKQDLLLPYVEAGDFYLIGCTTANPYVSLNRAIRSRTRLLEVKPLTEEEVVAGLKRAIASPKGLDGKLHIDDEALSFVARLSAGDLRFSLNIIEQCLLQYGEEEVDQKMVEAIERVPNYMVDKDEEEHYDSVSGLQKSIRGSDVDAAFYYLARLIASGDLDSIKRRLLVIAYEDVGLGNPAAVMRCQLSLDAVDKIGLPEAMIPLGFTVAELALSPKSRASCEAVEKAVEMAKTMPFVVPDYLRYTPVNLRDEDKYPYDRPDLWEKIQYLPESYKNVRFYVPNDNSLSNIEKALNQNYARLKAIKRSRDLATLKAEKPLKKH